MRLRNYTICEDATGDSKDHKGKRSNEHYAYRLEGAIIGAEGSFVIGGIADFLLSKPLL